MTTVQYRAPADMPADEAFAFMSGAPDLPRILPEATEDTRVRTDAGARRLTWGNDSDDQGGLRVLDRGANQCEIEIWVTTPQPDVDRVRADLAQAVAAMAHKASADADEDRAGQGRGWA